MLLTWKRGYLARRGRPTSARAGLDRGPCPLMLPTRLAVGLEPLNALDAAHRSPRSAPPSRTEFGSPVGSVTRQSIKRNKELAKHLIGESASQAGNRSRPNRWLHHYDSARHRRRVCCQLSRPGTRLVSARTTSGLHRIGRRRDDPVTAVPVPLSPRRLSTQRV